MTQGIALPQPPQKQAFDGEVMRTSDGRYWRIMAPRWWEVWRWIAWWLAPSRGRVRVRMAGDGWEGLYNFRAVLTDGGVVRSYFAGPRVRMTGKA